MANLLSDADVGFKPVAARAAVPQSPFSDIPDAYAPKLLSDADVGFEAPRITSEFGDTTVQSPDQLKADTGSSLRAIGNAAVQGFHDTPSILTPEAQAELDKGPIGRQIVNPALKVVGGGLAAGNAAMNAVAETANQLTGNPEVGRDVMTALQVLPVMHASAPVGLRDVAAGVIRAPNVDTAIAEASRVVRAPVETPLVTTTETIKPIATSAAAKEVAGAYYDKADQTGGTLTPDFTNAFLDEAASLVPQTRAGKIVAGEGPTTSLIDRIEELRDTPLSLREAQEIDEGLGNLIDKEYGPKGVSKEGYNLQQLQSDFRQMIRDAGPDQIEGGTEGFDALVQARKAWAQAMKLDDLERIQNRANLQEVPSTGIRTGLRSLLSNPARLRGYSPDEIAALRVAAERGVMGNLLHVFGSKLVPIGLGGHGLLTLNPVTLAGAGLAYGTSTLARNAGTALANRRLGSAMNVLGQSVPEMPRGLLNQAP